MTDTEYEKQKSRVEKCLADWVRPIGLGWWRITLQWHREDRKGDENEESACVAETHVQWQYLNSTIDFYLSQVESLEDDRLEYCVVHELCHIFVNEMRQPSFPNGDGRETLQHESRNHEERVVSSLALGFIWLKEHLTEGKKDEKASRLQSGTSRHRKTRGRK